MRDGHRLKHLFLKMSYDELMETCNREGWDVPYFTELKGMELKHDCVWTASYLTQIELDKRITEEDRKFGVKLGLCYEDGKEVVVNKNFKMNCVVWVRKNE